MPARTVSAAADTPRADTSATIAATASTMTRTGGRPDLEVLWWLGIKSMS
jgi:hypothetical protein